MAQAMGVPPKTENEECAGKTLQIRGSEGGRRGFTGTCHLGMTWRVFRWPSARLTHGLKLAIEVWRLRGSVFRGTPMAVSCAYFKELNCYVFQQCPIGVKGPIAVPGFRGFSKPVDTLLRGPQGVKGFVGDTFSADMRLTFDTQVCRRNPPLLRTLQNDGRDAQRGQGDREGILEHDGNIGLARRAGAVPHAARDLVNLGLIEPDRVSHLEPRVDGRGLAFVDNDDDQSLGVALVDRSIGRHALILGCTVREG